VPSVSGSVDPESLPAAHRGVLATALAVSATTPVERRRAGSTDDAVVEAAAAFPAPLVPLAELAYESGRGFHAVVVADDDGPLLAALGAPETVLARCTHRRGARFDTRGRRRLDLAVARLAGDGGRVLAVATRRLPGLPADGELDDAAARLDLVGFVVLADPLRADARPALDKITKAGVRPIVVTGDHPATARRLADDLGILVDGGTVVTGPELDRLDDDELDALLPELAVCARVTPEHKARLVAAFQRTGHVVAMTGDGVNDAAAIRRADVGIALGGDSTEAARRAADVVLVRDHIGSIVDAVIEGRSLWVAVRDAVANLLGHNYGEIAVIAGASLLTGTTPLTARQLLLMNLLTDTVPALSIAMRPPPDLDPARLLAEGPDRSFGPALKEAIAVRGIAMGLAGTGGYFAGRVTGTIQRARTITLLSMVGAQLGQTAIARPRDPVVVGGSLAAAALLLGIVETPGVSAVFGCRPVGPGGLAIAGTAATVGTVATLLLPAVLRKVRAFATDEATVEGAAPLVSVAPAPTLTAPGEQVAREREVATVG
jgi:magnesium-transporting ATPase (P-type)